MANTEGMKEKFVVVKIEDLNEALIGDENEDLRDGFNLALDMVSMYREALGKNTDNKYLVINTDESYADEVIDILKRNGHWG